jgi:hypothetical protein
MHLNKAMSVFLVYVLVLFGGSIHKIFVWFMEQTISVLCLLKELESAGHGSGAGMS